MEALTVALLSLFATTVDTTATPQPETQPLTQLAGESCESCHAGAARDFARGSMAASMTCGECHGEGHRGPGTEAPVRPSPKTCARCHAEEVAAFGTGKHRYGMDALAVTPVFNKMPSAVTDKGCVVCHRVGQVWADGSRGRCDECHTRHKFSAAEARRPQACATCHAGDHPHYEMWAASKHGKLYEIEGESGRAPGCVTCHGSHSVITAWGFLALRDDTGDDPEWAAARATVRGALEIMGPAKAPEVERPTIDEWRRHREDMVTRCAECHAESFSRRELEKGDALLREADLLKAKVIFLADKQYADGLIDEMTRFQLYREATAHRFGAFMGGFHNSPYHAWDKGYLATVSQVVEARDDAIERKKMSLMIWGMVGLAAGMVTAIVLAVVGLVG